MLMLLLLGMLVLLDLILLLIGKLLELLVLMGTLLDTHQVSRMQLLHLDQDKQT